MASGTTAKILHVDLSTRETRAETLPETVVRKYLGGGALVLRHATLSTTAAVPIVAALSGASIDAGFNCSILRQ